jgi:hypothetical protein
MCRAFRVRAVAGTPHGRRRAEGHPRSPREKGRTTGLTRGAISVPGAEG